jgi:peptidyl-prolyl cis-trans isomerase SurA
LYDYQENKLVDENPEFKNLVTEYRDGIMLFELTDRNVWNKALVDTVGLNNFYMGRKERYMWPASIRATAYKCADEDFAKKVMAAIADPNNAKAAPEEIVKIASGDGVQNKVYYETGKFEQTRFKGAMPYKAGKTSPYYRNDDGSYMVVEVKEVFNEPTQKTLSEARGFVISEYQEYLEKQWIADMEARYPVKVNETTLKSMVK